MILHPGIVALTLGSGITLLLLAYATVLGLRIARRWDIRSSSEEQLLLERRTYLVSVLIQYSLFFEIIALFLFLYTADDLHTLLTGAMCATGSLNANPYGFPSLSLKIVSVFIAAAWIALNYLDNKAEDYPLTKKKYYLLLILFPVVAAGDVLQILYFSGIDPQVITSCCGVLFSEGGSSAGSSLASLPVGSMRFLFYAFAVITIVSGIAARKTLQRPFLLTFALLSAIFFPLSIASVLSFISLYFYQLPTHHCPFDILQSAYYYVGYPLYASLFAGTFFGVMTGLTEPLKSVPSLMGVLQDVRRKWVLMAVSSLVIFVLLTLIPIVFLPFTLEGY